METRMAAKKDSSAAMAQLVKAMVLALVDEPGDVLVHASLREGCVVVDVKVAPTDVGKIIGKQGRTARSMRQILGAASMQAGVRCELNLDADGGRL